MVTLVKADRKMMLSPLESESLDLYQVEQLWYVEEVETVSNVQ